MVHISEKFTSWMGFRHVGFTGVWAPCIILLVGLHQLCVLGSFSDGSYPYPTPSFAWRPKGEVLRLMQIWLPLLSEGLMSLVGLAMETHGCLNGNQGLLGRMQWMLVRQLTAGFAERGTLDFSENIKFASMARRYRSYFKPLHSTVLMFSSLTENV